MSAARSRKEAYSPESSSWTLYRPEDLAEELGVDIGEADSALERTGFNKAVRIREHLIKWKTRLLREAKEITRTKRILREEVKKVNARERQVAEMLVGIRNILRISREKPKRKE